MKSYGQVEDARKAIELGSTKTVNIKAARVGKLIEKFTYEKKEILR